uniref:Uncharacterized protein n=1 Tax=Jaculus jaculus TaxID=51337 RepID=A0A8C5JZ65_JACJA
MESSESESPFCFSLNCLLKTLRLVCGLLAVVCTIADGALIYRKLRRRPSEPYEKDTSRDESEES